LPAIGDAGMAGLTNAKQRWFLAKPLYPFNYGPPPALAHLMKNKITHSCDRCCGRDSDFCRNHGAKHAAVISQDIQILTWILHMCKEMQYLTI